MAELADATQAAHTPGVGGSEERFWDFVVQVWEPDGGPVPVGHGFLLNDRAALVHMPAELHRVRLTTLVSDVAADGEAAHWVGGLAVVALSEPLADNIDVPTFDITLTPEVVSVTIGFGRGWAERPFDMRQPPPELVPGAPVLADGRIVGVVVSDGDDQPVVREMDALADALAPWAPEVQHGIAEVPFPFDDSEQYSPACWHVVRWFDAFVRRGPASGPALLWHAFVAAGREQEKSDRVTTASLIAAHLPDAAVSEGRPSQRVDFARVLTASEVLIAAAVIRDRTTRDARIHLRHLAAALVIVNDDELVTLGGDPDALKRDFLAFVREEVPEDDQDAWESIFTEAALDDVTEAVVRGRQRAGYHADAVGAPGQLTDELAVGNDVETLCDVLVAKDAVPPLSVGLFGRWGAGKSYFMGLMQQRMQALATAAKAAEEAQQETAYCSDVVQITFNAWHYMDANLWASLAVRIFEGISGDDEAGAAAAADNDVAALLAKLRKRESELATIDAKIGNALGDDRLDNVAKQLGVDATRKQLIEGLAEVSKLRGFLSALRIKLFGKDARRKLRGGLAAGAVVAATVAIALLVWRTDLDVPALLTAALGIAGIVGSAARQATKALRTVNKVLASAGLDPADVVKERQAKDAQIKEIKEQLRSLDRRRPLYDFVLERAGSEEYRKHFGLISLVRDDFEKLAHRLSTDAPGRRIVLYIDDLDRCPPDRVVEVLQAVHLLLAFPLFVVVVGVDPRWLLRSLERHYEDVLSPDIDKESWETTPQNYLEKIFQIPFALRPMNPGGFGRLVDAMFASTTTPATPVSAPDAGTEKAPVAEPGVATSTSTSTSTSTDAQDPPTGQSGGVTDEPSVAATTNVAPVQPRPPAIDPNPAALQVTPEEIAFLRSVAALVDTPRETKRLVNLYRLLRAALPSSAEIERFTRERDHEVVITLLAVLVGYPRQAREVFARLCAGSAKRADLPEPLARLIEGMPRDAASVARYRTWVDVAERFSFDTVLAARPVAATARSRT